MKAFLTGSLVYGRATEKSDIDLVVFLSRQDCTDLFMVADKVDGSGNETRFHELVQKDRKEQLKYINWDGPIACSLRFGNLNLICVTNFVAYHVWFEGTKQLCDESPVERTRAVEVFKALRLKHGIAEKCDMDSKPQTDKF